MAAIAVTAASVLGSSQAVHVTNYTFAATVTAGQIVFLNSANQWALADSDGALGTSLTAVRGIAANGGSINQPADVIISDPDFTPGGTLTNGLAVYLFTTPGSISQADIPATPAYPVFCGVAKSTTKMNLQFVASGVII